MRGEKRREEEVIKDWDAQEGGMTVRKRKDRDIFTEGAIKGLLRNITRGKFPGIHKNDPSLDSKQQWRRCLNCPSPVIILDI